MAKFPKWLMSWKPCPLCGARFGHRFYGWSWRKILPIILLSGCAMRVDVHWVETEQELQTVCGQDFTEDVAGCSRGGVMTNPPSECDIYVLSPGGAPSFDEKQKMRTLGHELLHCLRGRVHR